jgi:ABC-type oligopeptide transport system substrate-binding subunit
MRITLTDKMLLMRSRQLRMACLVSKPHQNQHDRTGWKNQQYDDLLQQANAELDPPRRSALLQRAEGILIREEVPVVPLYFYQGLEYFDAGKIEGVFTNILAEHPLRAIRKKK